MCMYVCTAFPRIKASLKNHGPVYTPGSSWPLKLINAWS